MPAGFMALALLAQPAFADGERFSLTSAMIADGDARWETYTPASQDLMSSLNGLGAEAFVKGHEMLGLANGSKTDRLLYLSTAGLAYMAFTRANSIIIGHEMAHWQTAHAFGRDQHEFRNHGDRKPVSFGKAYLRALLTGHAKASASSWSSDPGHELTETERSWANNAGVNWQTAYAERHLRENLMRGYTTVPGAMDYMINKGYFFFYAARDLSKDDNKPGDFNDFSRHLKERHGVDNAKETIAAVSLVSLLASPSFHSATKSFSSYVATGALHQREATYRIGEGLSYSWDIPNYANADSYTVAPTLYAVLEGDRAAGLHAKRAVIGVAFEKDILGDTVNEVTLSADLDFGVTDVSLDMTFGSGGHYADLRLSREVSKRLGLEFGLADSSGDTMRGKRTFPTDGTHAWAGISLRF